MIITQQYRQAGTFGGMPVIEEAGLCTNEASTLSDLREYETGRVEFSPVPRASGLVAKALDGSTLKTKTVQTPFGNFENCLQQDRTTLEPYAPRQPIGTFAGREIISYSRRWIHLGETGA